MKISKFAGIGPENAAAAAEVFEKLTPQAIACCNWPEQYPYAPKVQFRIFHSGETLWLRFDVEERYTAARVTEDNGRVWTDSCVEFFLELDESGYYNFETTCIGRMLLGFRKSHADARHGSAEVMASIRRYPSLPAGEPFEEREGDNRWSMMLAIPATALFRHDLKSWDGVEARMNLYKCGDDLSHPHFLSWQPIAWEKPNFHLPAFFAPARFE